MNSLNTPVFLAHSEKDGVIGIRYGDKLRTALEGLGMSVEWHSYDNDEHWITEPQGVDDMVAFFHNTMTGS